MVVRPSTAIVGYGDAFAEESDLKPPLTLAATAIRRAMESADLEPDDLRGNGLLTTRRPAADHRPQWNNALASYLNLAPRFTTEVTFHSGGAVSMVEYASIAVEMGICDYVVCAGADAAASLGAYPHSAQSIDNYTAFAGTMDVHPEFEYPYGTVMPATFGMCARRQMHELGHTEEDFARASVICRDWGVDHPHTTLGDKGRITIDDVLSSRMVASPLRLLNIMPLGPPGAAGAFIVTSAERAERMTDEPVYVRGYGSQSTHEYLTPRMNSYFWGDRGNLVETGLVQASERAYRMSGLGPEDVDMLQSTTATSNRLPLVLEDLGFCEKGEGGEFLAEGHLDPEDGRIAFNTDGGALTGGQPGLSLYVNRLVEAIRQLNRDPRGRLAPDAHTAIVYAPSGPFYACNAVTILSRGAA